MIKLKPKILKDVSLRSIDNSIVSPTLTLAKYTASLLSLFIGQSKHHLKNSKAFVQKLQSFNLKKQIFW
jgi:hypothetical protein